MGPLSLRRNVSYMLAGNMVYALSQWGIIMVLAKWGSPKMVGGFTLGLAVAAPIILIFDLQLRSVLATDTKNDFSFSQYITLKSITSAAALTVLVLTVIIGGYKGQTAWVIFLVGAAKLIESLIELYYGLFQKNERMDMIAKSLVLRGCLAVFIIAILIKFTNNLIIAVSGFVLSWALILLFQEIPKARKIEKLYFSSLDKKKIKNLLYTSLPLGIVMMMMSLYTNIPRYVLEHKIGTEAVGYYSALFYIITAGNLVINAIGQSISPRLAAYFSNKELASFSKLLTKFVLFGFLYGLCGIICAILIGKWVLKIIYTPEYVHYHLAFILLMIAGMFMYAGSFFGMALTSMRKFSIQPFLSIFWVVSALVASFLLIPAYGLTGAAIVAILTTGIQFLTLAISVLWFLSQAKRQMRMDVQYIN